MRLLKSSANINLLYTIDENNFIQKLLYINDNNINFKGYHNTIINQKLLKKLRQLVTNNLKIELKHFTRLLASGKIFCSDCGDLLEADLNCNCKKIKCSCCDYKANLIKGIKNHYTTKHKTNYVYKPTVYCCYCGEKLAVNEYGHAGQCFNKDCDSFKFRIETFRTNIAKTVNNYTIIKRIVRHVRHSRAAKLREVMMRNTYIGDKTKKELAGIKAGAKLSVIMKEKIKNGEFVPCVTNSWCRSRILYKGNAFRSSFEVLFKLLDTEDKLLYEKTVIPYDYYGVARNYIVDFTDFDNKILYEIKPKSEINNDLNKIKENAAIKWCKNNGFVYKIITEDYLKKYKNKIIDNFLYNKAAFDSESLRKINNSLKGLK